jgi:DNA-binding GntR family transcriptional regulator
MSLLEVEAPNATGVSRQASLGQQVASAVRRAIIVGTIPAGTALAQAKLCEQYDVSRIPVRDALLILANEGLLVRNRRNQMVVAEVTKQDLIDTFKVEAYLSGLAARRAAANATDADLAQLEDIIAEGEALDARDDKKTMAALSWRFHHRVNRIAGSPRLLATLRAVSMPLLQDFMSDLPSWWDDTQEEHVAITQALRNRDSDEAERLTVEHFAHAGDALLAAIDNRAAGTSH